MPLYTEQSLELLRQRIDLFEVLAAHLQLQRSGPLYRSLCPFHEEKTPSFILRQGEQHYHCFGCGAHGDAIAFLMRYLGLTFAQAVEALAAQFQVQLEQQAERQQDPLLSRQQLQAALEEAARFYHFLLLQSEEGHAALRYLATRGIDVPFAQRFLLGYAPKDRTLLSRFLCQEKGFLPRTLRSAGLQSPQGGDFFHARVMFPVRDSLARMIGFSGRKISAETAGGKYVNTPETALFKKSRLLYGMSESRRRIIRDKEAILVEGQLDALRAIATGLDYTVAAQGTAFGRGHVEELLRLGLQRVFVAMDGDAAGKEAAYKVGDLLQSAGVEVRVALLPAGSDPDTLLRDEGIERWQQLLQQALPYLEFSFQHLSQKIDAVTPAGKNALVQTLARQIGRWPQPIMVHESLRQLARLARLPEHLLPSAAPPARPSRSLAQPIDPDRVLETDLLRWLFLCAPTHPQLLPLCRLNLQPQHFRLSTHRQLYRWYCAMAEKGPLPDLLAIGAQLETETEQELLAAICKPAIDLQRALAGTKETIKTLLQRRWMEDREAIKRKILAADGAEEEIFRLAKEFDAIKRARPQVQLPPGLEGSAGG